MEMPTDGRPGTGSGAMMAWSLRAAALAGALALAACSGSGGGPMSRPDTMQPTPGAAAPLVSGLHFDYALERAGAAPIKEKGSEPLSCQAGTGGGCAEYDLRDLADDERAGMRGGFGTITVTGAPGGPLTETVSGVSVTVSDASFTRHGFWGEHGWAAVEIGTGDLAAETDGQAWSGTFGAAHAWTAGANPAGTNPAGAGPAVWNGIAGAVRTDDFEHLPGTAELRIADLAQPLIDVDIDLDDGGAGVELRWAGMEPADGAFAKGAAGMDRIDGRFHGPEHQEAWGVFDTGAYVGAFGAMRE